MTDTIFTPSVVFEDDSICVIDKPAGMIVNQANTIKHNNTVQMWAEKKLRLGNGDLGVGEGSDFYSRAGIVHRIDKETSGILIIAKTENAFVNLQAQFKKGEVSKTYIALVHGILIEKTGRIEAPIGRLPWNRIRFGIIPLGRASKTDYKVIQEGIILVGKEKRKVSLVECYPTTGRTHQIRVHMKFIGHPLFGDELYSGRKMAKKDRQILSRHFLHATKIEFTHPISVERIKFESKLPEELQQIINQITPLEV